ncbi:MAG: DUF4011 domain-containing protein, partial [Candidatus Sericytochromatia bacterium]|nr:DUF4011 domain-containing protein [Candidatus Sericytochromatia bacterium]
MTTQAPDIAAKLLASRRELLDIGLRNTLINFRAPKKSLALADFDPAVVFEALYVQQNALGFTALGRTKATTGNGEGELDGADLSLLEALGDASALPQETVDASPRRDKQVRLFSALGPEPLQLQLLKLRTEAQTHIEEKGVNVLYLAMGFLHWYEADSAQEVRKAPLILVPVSLERSNAR